MIYFNEDGQAWEETNADRLVKSLDERLAVLEAELAPSPPKPGDAASIRKDDSVLLCPACGQGTFVNVRILHDRYGGIGADCASVACGLKGIVLNEE